MPFGKQWPCECLLDYFLNVFIFYYQQVYLVRFKLESTSEQDEEPCSSPEDSWAWEADNHLQNKATSEPATRRRNTSVAEKTAYPTSVSIDVLLKAGQLIKPPKRNK